MGRKRYAVIVAGGRGTRMNSDIPKQFIEINGKPILRHTVEKFLMLDPAPEIIIVLPTDLKEQWKQYCLRTGFLERFRMVSGGMTRFHSVQNALQYVEDGATVAIHDAVRPFVSCGLLEKLYSEAEEKEAVIPTIPMTDSVRTITEEQSSKAIDRSSLVMVQTPQVFHSEVLKEAYKAAYLPTFTDDAAVVESAGHTISLAQGEKFNLKITTREDLAVASAIFSSSKS